MDELEAVWGPEGRATVDPASVRPVPASDGASRRPEPPVVPLAVTPADRAAVPPPPASVPRGPRPTVHPLLPVGAIALVVVLAVLGASALRLDRGSPAPPGSAAPATAAGGGSTATTIVSAAADLLGRSTTTTLYSGSNDPLPPTTAPPTTVPAAVERRAAPATGSGDLVAAERTAQDFVAALVRRDCDGVWGLLSAGTRELLTGSLEEGGTSGREELCRGLATEDIPEMRVDGTARATATGAVVVLVSDVDTEELHLLLEDGRWLVDLLGGSSRDA